MSEATRDKGSGKPNTDAPPPDAEKAGGDAMPAAGPHAKPELTNDMSTPGAGALPDADDDAGAQDSTTG